ncbi:MAG: glutamine amidotransferase [Endomicrobia bacterium]|nr:glutamine amidotransferase [Endomicrobiia bacterium]
MTLNFGYKLPKRIDNLRLFLMVDTSGSMQVNNRIQRVKNFLEKNYTKIKKYNTKIYGFNEGKYEIKKIDEIVSTNKMTKINSSIDELVYQLEYPSIVFLFSDGINFTEELPFIKKDKVKVIPVYVYDKEFRDKSIFEVRYSKIGFKSIDHEVKAYVYNYGYNDITKIKLIDIETSKVIYQNNFNLNEGINEITLKFALNKVGANKLKLIIEPSKNEVSYENNFVNLDIEVKKNKIRVLYLCGQPSAEYFNLRSLLKNDPYIDLVSFVILRNPESIAIVPDTESALIPFPVYDIFIKELFNFDLLIFENFTYRRFGIPLEYLENIRKFVLSGGGFIMIGGENSFFLGGYKFTPIEDILPVYLTEKEKFLYEEIKPDNINFNDKLTMIMDDKTENELYWKNLPYLSNYQLLYNKEDAIVLLSYKNNPIMCYAKRNKGRVFVSATNSTWRWRLGNVFSEKYDFKSFYDKFWKKVIYYCAGVEDIKNINIICDENYKVSEEVNISILLSNIDNIVSFESYLTLPDFSKKPLKLRKIQKDRYYTSFLPTLPGRYAIGAILKTEKYIFKEEKFINVTEANYKEMAYLKPNAEYMKKLADFYSTQVISLDNLDISEVIENFKKEFSQNYTETFWIYRNPFLGLIFILVFLLEIYIARFK